LIDMSGKRIFTDSQGKKYSLISSSTSTYDDKIYYIITPVAAPTRKVKP